MEGSELEEKANHAEEFLYTKVEARSHRRHDDPPVYVLAEFVTSGVTHLATCDKTFIDVKAGKYGEALTKDPDLNYYIKFVRRNKNLMVDLPSKILEDLKKRAAEFTKKRT